MTSYLLAASWGIVILVSWAGWGSALRLLFFPEHAVDWGLRAAWGMAFSVCCGGVLNLLGASFTVCVVSFLGIGLALVGFDLAIHPIRLTVRLLPSARFGRVGSFVLLATLVVAGARYAASVSNAPQTSPLSPTVFNLQDDFHAYFVFPVKMLQTGSLGSDPFSERRMSTSLGGQAFLHSLVLCALSPGNLHLIEPGVALLLVLGLLLGLFEQLRTPPLPAACILLCAALLPAPTVNTSAVLTGLALLLGLARTLSWRVFDQATSQARACVIALLAAGVCALKSSFIPVAASIVFSYYLFRFASGARRGLAGKVLLEMVATVALTGLLLLPWMILMRWSSGTFLFPLFGIGYHGDRYGWPPSAAVAAPQPPSRWAGLYGTPLRNTLMLALALLGIALLSRFHDLSLPRRVTLVLFVSCFAGIATLLYASQGSAFRFCFPFVVAAVLFGVSEIFSEAPSPASAPWSVRARRTAAILSLPLVFMLAGVAPIDSLRAYLAGIRFGLDDRPLLPDGTAERYAELQRAVPPGETLLVRLEQPFLLDFARNRVFVADLPGWASLPPGMPLFEGPEPLAEYLLSRSIRFVAYSYAREANFSKRQFGARTSAAGSGWARWTAERAFDFQDNLTALGTTRKRIHDDGANFVLDLSRRERGS